MEALNKSQKVNDTTQLFTHKIIENVHNVAKVLNLETNYSLNDKFSTDLDKVYKNFNDRLPMEVFNFIGQKMNSIQDFAYVSDGRILVLCYTQESVSELRLFELNSPKAIEMKKLSEDCLRCLHVSEAMNLVLVSGGLFENKVFVLSLNTLEEVRVLSTNKQVKSISQCFVKNCFFSLQFESGVTQWDLQDIGKFSVVSSENFDFLSVSQNSGLVALANSYGKLVLMTENGKIEAKETMKIKSVLASAFGEFLAVGGLMSVVVYKVGKDSLEVVFSQDFESSVKELVFIRDNILVVVFNNSNICFIDFCLYRKVIKMFVDKVKKIRVVDEENLMVLTDNKLYTIKIPYMLPMFKIENCRFTALLEDKKCAYVMDKDTLNEFDLVTGVHRELIKTTKDIQKLEYIDESRLLISISGRLIVFNPQAMKIELEKETDDEFIYIFKVNHAARQLYTGGTKKVIRIFNLDTLEKQSEFSKHVSNILNMIVNKAWSTIITREVNFVRVFDTNSQTELKVFEEKILTITLTRDEKRLFLGKQSVIKIVDMVSFNTIFELNHLGTLINGVHFMKDDKFFITLTSDAVLRFWDYSTLTLTFELPTSGTSNYLKFSNNEELILVRTDIKFSTILLIKNPLFIPDINFIGPSQDYFGYLKYFIDIKNKKPVTYQEDFDKSLILPHCLTFTHLFSYQGMSGQLKQCLAFNPVFSKLTLNYTPLDICLILNHKNSVLVYLKHLTKNIQQLPFIANSINQKNLIKLNSMGFEGLTSFYNSLLYINPYPNFPSIVKNSVYLPKVRKSEEFLTDLNLFDVTFADEGIGVEFVTSLVQLNLSTGSKESIDFLSSLLRCPLPDIFRSTFIQIIIDYKWNYIFLVTVTECILFVIYMCLLSAVALVDYSLGTFVAFFVFGFVLTTYEVLQILGGIKVYLKDFWNFVDITRSGLMITYLDCIANGRSYTSTILLTLTLVSWVRGISYFRIFSKTRYMINLIIEVCKDVTAFLIILAYSTIAFSFILMLMVDHTDYYTYFQLSYLITLGNINSVDYNTVQWVCFIITTIINPIIMINLLISIMGDTHDKVQENKEVAEYKELASLVFDVEVASIFLRTNSKYERFHICQEIITKGIASTWMGKVREIKSMISSLKLTQTKTNDLNTQILNENLKLKEQLNRVEKIMMNLKEKLTTEDVEANEFEVSCQKGHKLNQSYHYESMAKCNKCGTVKEVGYSCGLCTYFLCKSCYKSILNEKISVSEFSCFREHKLTWLSDHLQYKNKLKVFSCAGCKKRLFKDSFNCEKCSWDICRKCVEIIFTKSPQAWTVHCPNNHSLSWVKKGHPTYKCNKCLNLFSSIGSFMCPKCNFDYCIRCFSIELGK